MVKFYEPRLDKMAAIYITQVRLVSLNCVNDGSYQNYLLGYIYDQTSIRSCFFNYNNSHL